MDLRLKEILQDEQNSFRDDACDSYVQLADACLFSPCFGEAVVFVGASPVKRYVSTALAALRAHDAVLLAGKGEAVSKLVTVAEQVKQQAAGRVVQLNRGCDTDSLVNPGLKAEASVKNVHAFFGDAQDAPIAWGVILLSLAGGAVGLKTDASVGAAVRLIRGPKVYRIPTMMIFLATGEVKGVEGWTRQVKAA